VGGVSGYQEFLDVIFDPTHEEYDTLPVGLGSFPGRRVRRESGERNPFRDALAGET
jgi:hypothetical protein